MYYSLSGETEKVVDAFAKGLKTTLTKNNQKNNHNAVVCIDTMKIQTNPSLPFPWKSLWNFFDIMAETVCYPRVTSRWKNHANSYQIISPPELLKNKDDDDNNNNNGAKKAEDGGGEEDRGGYDVIIIGWQTWFLSPCLPIQLALTDPDYQKLLFFGSGEKKTKQIVLIGTHRNMWHRASRTLHRQITNIIAGGGNNNDTTTTSSARIAGQINFVQQNNFLQSIYHTVVWQLYGNKFKGKAALQESVEDQAFQYGKEWVNDLNSSNNDDDFLPLQGGIQHKYSIELVERFWFLVKKFFSSIMGLFPPLSAQRKTVTVFYAPLLGSFILCGGVPIIFVGSLIETGIRYGLGNLLSSVPPTKSNNNNVRDKKSD